MATASPSDGMLRGKWWEIYNDPQLNKLEERIATYNQGLHAALENYLAAREQVKMARAAYYPSVAVQPSGIRRTTSYRKTARSQLKSPPRPINYSDITSCQVQALL